MVKAKRRAHGEGGLFQRPDGLWVAAVAYFDKDGKRKSKRRASKDYLTAVNHLRDLRDEVAAGVVGSAPTVGEWLDYWIEEVKKPELRPNTYRDYRASIASIKPVIGDVRLSKLEPADLRRMHKAAGSSAIARKQHQLMHQSLKDAVSERKVIRNVAADQRRPKHVKTVREGFPVDVAKHIMRIALVVDERMASRWAAAFLTGARQGELLGLTWDRVNAGSIDLSWQLQQMQKVHGCKEPCGRVRPGWCPQAKWDLPRGFEHKVLHRSLGLARPKTEAGTRIVPVAPALEAMLDVESRRPGDNPHNLVWHQPDGRPVSPRDDCRAWTALLVAAGVPHKGMHSCRHTTATLLLECGVDAHIVQAIVGHSDVVVTRGYQHADLTLRAAAVSRLDSLLAVSPQKA